MGKQKLETLVAGLRAAAVSWRSALKRIGEILLAIEQAEQPAELYMRTILQNEFGVPLASSQVALRWARGDYGDDAQAEVLLARVPHSVLALWSAQTITEVLSGTHRIASPDEGKVVAKQLAAMSRREVARNVDQRGFVPIGEQVIRLPMFRWCKAERIEADDTGVFVVSTKPEPIRMFVSRKLIRELTEVVTGESRKAE